MCTARELDFGFGLGNFSARDEMNNYSRCERPTTTKVICSMALVVGFCSGASLVMDDITNRD